jgi:hypothetical protein
MVFWFFNALNKSYTTNISLPVEFRFDPQYYIAVKPPPDEVRLNVTGIGWNLFRRSAGLRGLPLIVPLERPADVKKIVGTALPSLFTNPLEGMQINYVLTDTIYLSIEPRAGRWITLELDSVEQYIRENHEVISKITISPDSIFVEGPINQITRLKEPYNVTLGVRDIDEDFTEEVEVTIPDGELIRRNPPVVFIAFSVEQLIRVEDSVRLEVINYPSQAKPVLELKKVYSVFRIRQSMLETFQVDSITAILDLKDFTKGEARLAPVLKGVPPHTKVLEVDTVSVKF